MTGAPFTYGSVCSGIEAATMAWHPLGWQAKFFSEIDAFPSAVLAHHYGSNMPGEPLARNGIPNYGDFTTIGADAGPVDLLVGGTPCQSFSVAGKRLGLDDPRGNLALEYLALAKRLGARWIVWENVPGVLSSLTDEEDGDGGVRPGLEGRKAGDEWIEESDFATFLSFVRECGYGFAYRVLDAQYVRVRGYERAVPQRRRRVFVVGYLGDFRPAAAVLFEPEGLRGDHPPRREATQGFASALSSGLDGGRVARALNGSQSPTGRLDATVDTFVCRPVASTMRAGGNQTGGNRPFGMDVDTCDSLIATREAAVTLTRGAESAGKGGYAGRRQEDDDNLVAHSLRGEGFDASEDGTGRGTPIVSVAFQSSQSGVRIADVHATLDSNNGARRHNGVIDGLSVRRLMPIECERLQGFPDGYTDILYRNRPAADGPRYKALGNSMAVNAMRWIGERIHIFETEVKGKI